MSEAPQTWRQGLVARWWAEFNLDGPKIAYFQALIERHGQPALDAGRGAGRLLVPFLRASRSRAPAPPPPPRAVP